MTTPPNQPSEAHDEQTVLPGGREVKQHLSHDNAHLDELDSASADSFPSSDPPSMSVPSAAAPTKEPDTDPHADAGTITDPD